MPNGPCSRFVFALSDILLGSNYFPQLEYKKSYRPNLFCLTLVLHVCSVKESLNRNNKQKLPPETAASHRGGAGCSSSLR